MDKAELIQLVRNEMSEVDNIIFSDENVMWSLEGAAERSVPGTVIKPSRTPLDIAAQKVYNNLRENNESQTSNS